VIDFGKLGADIRRETLCAISCGILILNKNQNKTFQLVSELPVRFLTRRSTIVYLDDFCALRAENCSSIIDITTCQLCTPRPTCCHVFPAVWFSTNRQAPSAADLVQNPNYGSERDPWSTIMDASRDPLTINISSMAILDGGGGERRGGMFKAHNRIRIISHLVPQIKCQGFVPYGAPDRLEHN